MMYTSWSWYIHHVYDTYIMIYPDVYIMFMMYTSWSWYIHHVYDVYIMIVIHTSCLWCIHHDPDTYIMFMMYTSWSWYIHHVYDTYIMILIHTSCLWYIHHDLLSENIKQLIIVFWILGGWGLGVVFVVLGVVEERHW
jgi:hypothetical protein